METGLIDLHGLIKWAVLAGLVVSTLFATLGLDPKNSKAYNFKASYLFTLIAGCFQVCIGWVVYFNSSFVAIFWSNPLHMTKSPNLLFFSVVHPVLMVWALTAMVWAYKTFKTTNNPAKILRYYVMALLLVLGAIPWGFYGFS